MGRQLAAEELAKLSKEQQDNLKKLENESRRLNH
jgi:hypothetical protein